LPWEIVKLGPQECRLWDALERLKREMKLPDHLGDMATEIMRVAGNVTSLWDNNAWSDTEGNGDLLLPFIEETKNALRDHAHLKSAREAGQLAKSIWSARRNRRGRDHEINPDLLVAVVEALERIAGEKLSYSRKRYRRAPLNASASGPPEGAMFDVLLAALDWAYALPTPNRRTAPFKPEGVLSAVKRIPRSGGRN
jgi:hypothetical protein